MNSRSLWKCWTNCLQGVTYHHYAKRSFTSCKSLTFRCVLRIYTFVHCIFQSSLLFRLQSVLCAHDAIAQKDFYPHLPEIPIEVDEDEETVKIVQLVKNSEPLVSESIIDYFLEYGTVGF